MRNNSGAQSESASRPIELLVLCELRGERGREGQAWKGGERGKAAVAERERRRETQASAQMGGCVRLRVRQLF